MRGHDAKSRRFFAQRKAAELEKSSPPSSEVQQLRAQVEQKQREIENLKQKLSGPTTNNFEYSLTPLQQLGAQLLLQQIAPLAIPLY